MAESTEILRPITQLGCAQAWAGVICAKSAMGVVRKGPPEAVNHNSSTPHSALAASLCKALKPDGKH